MSGVRAGAGDAGAGTGATAAGAGDAGAEADGAGAGGAEAVTDRPSAGTSRSADIAHGAFRGTIAAMAMTGMRSLTVSTGLVEEPPPRAILRQRSKGVLRAVPKRFRRAGQELFHWGFGATGGAAFAILPRELRMQPWAGPVWGLGIWLGFELGAAPALGLKQAKEPRRHAADHARRPARPALGLKQAKEPRPVDRVTLAADHLLYGLVLSELRRRPRG